MGMIFKKAWTAPVPLAAEITNRNGKRIARWRLRNGKLRTNEIVESSNGQLRYRGQTQNYWARYRDGAGRIVEVTTGCKEAVPARAILTKLERDAELIRAGVITDSEADAATHAHLPLTTHFDAYVRHLKAKGGDPRRISMVRRRLERLARECRFGTLGKLNTGPVERWLVDRAEEGMAATTRNTYRESLVGFGNWCSRTNRLTHNPFADLPRANPKVDLKHQRRALTEKELMRLLKIARLRPLAERGRKTVAKNDNSDRPAGSRATWKRELLNADNIEAATNRARETLQHNPDLIDQLECTGRERVLIYKTLVLTGLRKGELASLTAGQLDFGGPVAYAILHAADEKNRQGSNIPIRADLADELSIWCEGRLSDLQEQARISGKPIPVRLPPSTPLFNVPSGLIRIFDRDLAAAGNAKRDDRNRVVDVHALRVTFGTHLSAVGVPVRTVQSAMRHSKIDLTMSLYVDPKFHDVAGAIESLPSFSITSAVAETGS